MHKRRSSDDYLLNDKKFNILYRLRDIQRRTYMHIFVKKKETDIKLSNRIGNVPGEQIKINLLYLTMISLLTTDIFYVKKVRIFLCVHTITNLQHTGLDVKNIANVVFIDITNNAQALQDKTALLIH